MSLLKKILNPLYLMAILLSAGLYLFLDTKNEQTGLFFGFAENKETEMNLDYPVKVVNINVKPGDFISKGTKLAELNQITLNKEISDENLRIGELSSEFEKKRNEINGEIELLRSDLNSKLSEIDSKIGELNSRHHHQQKLTEGLSTIDLKPNNASQEFLNEQINILENEKQTARLNFDQKVLIKEQRIKDERKTYTSATKRHYSDVDFTEQKLKKLALSSPADALVGNVHIREGEYIQSFKTMVTLYEPNPSMVAGYVHESMMVNVEVGDKFEIKSTQNPNNSCVGVVTGLGSRIVEIPERLRKIATMKTYGREVLITIPSDNKFLQKEKVVIYLEENGDEKNNSTAQKN